MKTSKKGRDRTLDCSPRGQDPPPLESGLPNHGGRYERLTDAFDFGSYALLIHDSRGHQQSPLTVNLPDPAYQPWLDLFDADQEDHEGLLPIDHVAAARGMRGRELYQQMLTMSHADKQAVMQEILTFMDPPKAAAVLPLPQSERAGSPLSVAA